MTEKGDLDGFRLSAFIPLFFWDLERTCDQHDMDGAERWAYLRVLVNLYDVGGYAANWKNVEKFSQLSRHKWKNIEETFAKLLTVTPEGITHHRVIEQLAKAKRTSDQRSEAANARWKNRS